MESIKAILSERPLWMNGLLAFCAYMTFIYMPFDIFLKPVAEDQEVWFGFVLTGWAAKATAPLHWLIYGAGFYGFLRMKSWMWPWASLYTLQVAISMLVWAMTDPRGGGLVYGAVAAVPFTILAVALWRTRHRFGARLASSLAPQDGNAGNSSQV